MPTTNNVQQEDGLARLRPSLRALAERGVERRYRRGTILIQEGEAGGSLYFVVSGRVRAYTVGPNGHEFTFGFYGAGEYMGELSLDGGARSASVVVEDAALCRIVTQQTIKLAIAADPELAFDLLAKVIQRCRDLSIRARDLALDNAYGRLAQLLRAEAVPQPDGTAWMPDVLTQEQMAQQIGCSRPMVTRLLGDLVKGGYLRRDQKRWRLLKALPPEW